MLVVNAGIRPRPHANNNRIERLNGTLCERVKVQRGWRSMKTLSRRAGASVAISKPLAALEDRRLQRGREYEFREKTNG